MKRNPAPSFVSFQKFAELKSTPWKNGGGISSEIAIEPANAALADANFLWRLSAAEISAPGPFSKFPGYDRLLALVRGKALELEFPQKSLTKKASLGQILAFSGDDEAQSKIPAGSVADLNLIFRRSEVRARMSLVEFPKSRPRSFELDAETVFFSWNPGPRERERLSWRT